ncbi:hypothetical protein LINPERPRIM_LOCUS29611 [Linum perenne]
MTSMIRCPPTAWSFRSENSRFSPKTSSAESAFSSILHRPYLLRPSSD